MFYSFLFLWAQLEGDAGEVVNETVNEAAQPPSSLLSFMLPMMLALFVMMLLMRPRKGDQKLKQQMAALKKNDRIVTAGGIIGTVVSIREDTSYVTLRIDDSNNTRIQILKSSIIKVLTDEKSDD